LASPANYRPTNLDTRAMADIPFQSFRATLHLGYND
jgi:hypothetical protein